MTSEYAAAYACSSGEVKVRRNPYPYKAMLAICSDLDETVSADVYLNTSRYLNTTENTPFGKGLGLETGNTIFFYMPDTEFSYWDASEKDRQAVRSLIQSGHIDSIHSFGDLATSRSQAAETLEHLDRHGCKMKVWIDHAIAPTNFGADIMQGHGDVPGHDAYHADLTLDYGVQYIWTGRVTSMHGQDAPVSLAGIGDSPDGHYQYKTALKEAAKVVLGMTGNTRYRMHSANRLLRTTTLRDGQVSKEFFRSNPHPGGISVGDNSKGIGTALRPAFLNRLEARGARSIVYTHLGKLIDPLTGFAGASREAFEDLAARQHEQKILVTTTYRLLNYASTLAELTLDIRVIDGTTEITVNGVRDDASLDGLSLEVPATDDVRVTRDGREIPVRSVTGAPNSSRKMLIVDWHRLDYPGVK
tara:strand:- start:2573 stop:3820 length:1248 start_codon:yes stop_codon:yes gene_type:complete